MMPGNSGKAVGGQTLRSSTAVAALLVQSILANAALAGEVLLQGPAPDWVLPAPALEAKNLGPGAPAYPLFDEQTLIDGGKNIEYVDSATTITSPEQLNRLGTMSVSWQPQHGDLTVHRIEILRGSEVIDLLKNGLGFTILRREAGLESQIIDGRLTAVRQIEGLRIGDVLRMAFSVAVSDTLLGGRAQTGMLLVPKPTKVGYGRARLVWPKAQNIAWKALMPGIADKPRAIAGGLMELAVAMPVAALPEMPADAPVRFRSLPVISATSFKDWSEVSSVMAPLYRTEGTIAEGSDLAKAADALAKAHADPVERLAAALRMVQSDVRYQLIALGTGNYQPQAPAQTWQMRYGDCKAKTLLLLALLHRMGIAAEPVLANSQQGGLVPSLLPAAQAFDHVFVRAEMAGESFWLDGTSLGARLADIRDVPRLGHVLPVRAKGAALLELPIRANARPSVDLDLAFDGTAGPHLPTPFMLKVRYSGATAEQLRTNDGADEEKLMALAENAAKSWVGTVSLLKPSVSYDPEIASWTLAIEGLSYPEWTFSDGRLKFERPPTIKIAFDPDRSRAAWQKLPAEIANPWTAASKMSVRLPALAADAALEGDEPVSIMMPAVAYDRKVRREGATVTEDILSRESGAEIAPGEISKARQMFSELGEKPLRISLPTAYPRRWDDVARLRQSPELARIRAVFDQRIADKPEDADRLAERGWLETRLLNWAAAEADYGKAIALDASPNRYLLRAAVRSRRGDKAGALTDALAAYDLDSGNKAVRTQLAEKYSSADQPGKALELLGEKQDVTTEDGEGEMQQRAEIVLESGNAAKAIGLLDAALVKRPNSPGLLNARCWIKGLANMDLAAALADCTRAVELAAEPAGYFDSRAMVHFRAGRLDDALRDLNAALEIEPELAQTLFMRGVVAARQGNAAASRADLAAARMLTPSIDRYYARYGLKP
jgi:tetratricopeptide (TPR) repeat protein